MSWYWFIGQSNKEQSKKRGTRGLTQMVPSITTQQYCHSKKNLNIIAVEVSSILSCSKHASHFISISFARNVQRTMSNDKLQLQLQQKPCWFYYQFQLPKTIAVLFTGWLLPPFFVLITILLFHAFEKNCWRQYRLNFHFSINKKQTFPSFKRNRNLSTSQF